MIGWYADVGFVTVSSVTNISQFTVLDSNVPITIPTSGGNFSFNDASTTANKSTCADGLLNALGQDYYTLFIPPNRTLGSVDSTLNIVIPSYDNSFPNTYRYIRNNPNTVNCAVHLKSIGILIVITGSANTIYDISIDGSITHPSGIPSPTVFYVYTAGCVFPGVVNYSDGDFDLYFGSVWDVTSLIVSYGPSTNSDYKTWVRYILNKGKPDFEGNIPPPNPYEPGGPSGPTDPDLPPGTFDDSSDPIPDSSLPTISAADTGFTRIYNPTLSQVQALAQYLWTTPDVIETIWNHIKKFFENPMDAIIGFNLVPVPVPDGGTTNFKLMYIDTGVAMTAAANQFVDVDCGTLEVKRYYGSALDQSPYTKVSCFLPYIGTVQLNTDEVMGATLQVKYRVDICSGSCVAKIFIDGNCIYQYSGHCAINIPISSADFSSYVSAAINVAKLAIGAATAGAGGAAMAAAQVAGSEQQTGNMVSLQSQGGSSPNLPTIYQGQPTQPPPSQTTTSASFAGLSPANVSNTVGEIMNAKPHVEHSGSFSGNTGYLGVRRPFIIIERPNMCMPENYQALNGFPTMITMELSTCKGFTRVQQVQLTGMTATNPEQAEILELLKSGVIL